MLSALLLFPSPMLARIEESALSTEQTAQARAIENRLIAPCCFSQTVANHHSQMAESMKAQVRQMLVAGATEQQIINFFLDKYGERILAAPRANGFNLLAYFVPVLVLGTGAVMVVIRLRHWRKPVFAQPPSRVNGVAGSTEETRRFQSRLQEELARFDA